MPAKHIPAPAKPAQWLQLHGDPSVRRFLFDQSHVVNEFDECADYMLNLVARLMRRHGVFHTRIYCSSGCVMGWSLSDPLRYWVLQKTDLMDPDFLDRFADVPYPEDAVIKRDQVLPILERFKELRFSDENIYLRVASLNIFNGMVEMRFSCDGHHYVDHEQFMRGPQYSSQPLDA